MADINIDYDALQRAISRLKAARQKLSQRLQQLKSMMDNLISSQFKTTAASGKLGDAYTRFNNAARKLLEALDGMTSYLQSVIQQHQDLDQDLAGGYSNLGPRG